MPLTAAEVAFLGPYVEEYMNLRRGPAGAALRERGIRYPDIDMLMDLYTITHPPRIVEERLAAGEVAEVLRYGPDSPPYLVSPWRDVVAARRRNVVAEAEVMAHRAGRGG